MLTRVYFLCTLRFFRDLVENNRRQSHKMQYPRVYFIRRHELFEIGLYRDFAKNNESPKSLIPGTTV